MKKSLIFFAVIFFQICQLSAQNSFSESSIYQSGILNKINGTSIAFPTVAADTMTTANNWTELRQQMMHPTMTVDSSLQDKKAYAKVDTTHVDTTSEVDTIKVTVTAEEVAAITAKYEALYKNKNRDDVNLNTYQQFAQKNRKKWKKKEYGDGKGLLLLANIIGAFYGKESGTQNRTYGKHRKRHNKYQKAAQRH